MKFSSPALQTLLKYYITAMRNAKCEMGWAKCEMRNAKCVKCVHVSGTQNNIEPALGKSDVRNATCEMRNAEYEKRNCCFRTGRLLRCGCNNLAKNGE